MRTRLLLLSGLGLAAAGLLVVPVVAQNTGVNPTVGSVWTYLGATYGAGWVVQPQVSFPYVENNAALAVLITPSGQVYRAGFYAAGDGGAMVYTHSNSACSLNGGVGDDGSQVKSADGGCWLADFSGMNPTPKVWGAKGDGTTDDTARVQSALNASSNRALWVTGTDRYKITSPLSTGTGITTTLISDSPPVSAYSATCPSGFITTSNINLLTLTGPSATVRGICFQMGNAAGDRTAGYALKVGATATTQQGHAQIVGNTVLFPYDGILVGGSTTGATQTNSHLVADNVVVSPKHEGISIGRESSEASTVGTTLRDNQVVCFAANSAAIGIAQHDGAMRYYGGDSGPYQCNIGFAIIPGAVGGNRQMALGQYDGVLGDSSLTADLLVDVLDPSAAAFYLKFVNAWAGSTTATDTPVLIKNTASGAVRSITIVGSTFHSGGNQTTPIIDVQGGVGILIDSNQIVSDGGGTTTGPGVRIGPNAAKISVTGNQFGGGSFGTLATGIQLPSLGVANGSVWTITGNDFSTVTTPIAYTPTGETAVIRDNMGIANVCSQLTAASTITIPNAAECIALSGSTTVQTVIGFWSARRVTVYSQNGVTLAAGGTAPGFCGTNLVMPAGSTTIMQWNNVSNCWAKVP